MNVLRANHAQSRQTHRDKRRSDDPPERSRHNPADAIQDDCTEKESGREEGRVGTEPPPRRKESCLRAKMAERPTDRRGDVSLCRVPICVSGTAFLAVDVGKILRFDRKVNGGRLLDGGEGDKQGSRVFELDQATVS